MSNVSATLWREQVTMMRDNDDVHFIRLAGFLWGYRNQKLKQQSESRHVAPIG